MANCVAFNCHNKGSLKIMKSDNVPKISFFSFPLHNQKRCQLWIDALKFPNWAPSKSSRICSEHFSDDSFYEPKKKGYSLKENAVPSIFDFPTYLLKEGDDNDPGNGLGEGEARQGPPPLGHEEGSNESRCQDISDALLRRQIIPDPVVYESVMELLHLRERIPEHIFEERVFKPLLHKQRSRRRRKNRKNKNYIKKKKHRRRYVNIDSVKVNSSSEVRARHESDSTIEFASEALVLSEVAPIILSDLESNRSDIFIKSDPFGDDNYPGNGLGEDEARQGLPPQGLEVGYEPQRQDVFEALLQRQIVPDPVIYKSVMEPLHLKEIVPEPIFEENVPEPLLHEQRVRGKRRNYKSKNYSKKRKRLRRYVNLDSPIVNSSSEVRARHESDSTIEFASEALVLSEVAPIILSDLESNRSDIFIKSDHTQITADVKAETKREITAKSEILEDLEGYQMDTLIPDFFVPESLGVLETQTCVKPEKLLACEMSSSVDNNGIKMEKSLTDDEFQSMDKNETFLIVKTEICQFDFCDDSSTKFFIKTENSETSKPHFLTDNLTASSMNTIVSSNLKEQEEQTSYVNDDPVIEDIYMKRCDELLEKIKKLQDSTEDVVSCVFCKTKMFRKYSFNHLLRIHNFSVDVATILLPSSFKM